jgi:predicted ribonuclease YlaK
MELQESHRHAVGVGVVLRLVHVESLLANLAGPVGIGKTALDVAAGLEERRDRRTFRIEREGVGRWL